MNCQSDWLNQHIENALNHFGRTTEPKKVMCDQAWYKDYTYGYPNNTNYRLLMIYLVNAYQLLNNSLMTRI